MEKKTTDSFIFVSYVLSPEDMDGSDDVLPTNGTLGHPSAAVCTSDHMSALEKHAIDHRVPTDFAQLRIHVRMMMIRSRRRRRGRRG